MSKYPSKASMPIAIDSRSQLDLSCIHTTTSNFMELGVAHCMEVVPKQSVNIHHNQFNRLESMPTPTYGVASQHCKAFFVPYRTIFPAWNDFINDVSHTYSNGITDVVTSVPTVPNSVFVNFLRYNALGSNGPTSISEDVTDDVDATYDFEFIVPTDLGTPITVRRYRFTPRGKRAYKILLSLGYRFNFNGLDVGGFSERLSLLPLFSLLRVYLDWYFPQNYAESDRFYRLEKWLKYDSNVDIADDFDFGDLVNIFDAISLVSYDSDFVVSAWDNPMSPNVGAYSPMSVQDITNGGNVSLNSDGTPITNAQTDGIVTQISQFMLTSLKSLSDYMQRHKIAGARSLDRYLSRFGIVLDSAKLDRSQYLAGSNSFVDFHDVTSTADTDGAELGAYAGKGVGENNLRFSFTSSEYGTILILSTVVPRVTYYQGRSRFVTQYSKLDFWTPEFDNLGVQALSTAEVYLPELATKMYPNGEVDRNFQPLMNTRVFGFLPRYAHYKYSRDSITGDYALNSLRAGNESWTFRRDLSSLFEDDGVETPHSVDFVLGNDSQQYSRIFYDTSDRKDKFNVVHTLVIDTSFPGRSLYDTYEFDSERAQRVNIDAGGVKAN